MTLTETTERSQTESLSFELDLPHPPEKVWRALTEPELLAQWLLPAFDFKLEAGAAFRFETQPYPGWDGKVSCRFVTIEPLRKLVYTWSVPFLETVVTFTLAPTGAGTHLSIVQSGFQEGQKREFGGARYGWKMMAEKLVALLARSS